MNAFGIIFSDRYSTHERHELVRTRSCASLPIACRYRAIDFLLSGMVGAGIYTVGLLTKQNYGSLMDHIGSGKDWDLGRKNGGITMLTPYSHGNAAAPNMMSGKLDALRSIVNFIEDANGEYVVLGQGNMVANLDFNEIMKRHIQSGADITIVYAELSHPDEKNLAVSFDEKNNLNDAHFCTGSVKADISLNCYIMRKDLLLAFLEKANLYNWHDLGRDLILRYMGKLRICGYRHTGYAAIVDTVSQFYKCNMDMLSADVQNDLFPEEHPVLTRIKDTVPTLYAYHAKVSNCLLADGCDINGTISNSIIFRNVTVEQGAVLENCVIMQGTHIGKNARLTNVICDKNVRIGDGVELTGSEIYPYVLTKGSKV